MLRIGVLGAGHLGKIHIKLWKEIEGVQLMGFYDPDFARSFQVQEEFHITSFDSIDNLISSCDAVDIVAPTIHHFALAQKAIQKRRHVFVEKPLANSVREAEELVKQAHEAGVKGQVGHVERFNPAFLALKNMDLQPMFIETHRLAVFNPRGTDVSVVYDLMIHDIDLLLSVVKANVKRVHASGVAVVSKSPDIANARIEFDNGCVANLTASRISMKNMRKMRMFQKDAYISLDFLEKKAEVIRLLENADPQEAGVTQIELAGGEKKFLKLEWPHSAEINALKLELEMFRDSILYEKETPVSLDEGYRAMKLAHTIQEKIRKMLQEAVHEV